MVSEKLFSLEGLNMSKGSNLTINSDVNHSLSLVLIQLPQPFASLRLTTIS